MKTFTNPDDWAKNLNLRLSESRESLKTQILGQAKQEAAIDTKQRAESILSSYECPVCGEKHSYSVTLIRKPDGGFALGLDGACSDEALQLAGDHVLAVLSR